MFLFYSYHLEIILNFYKMSSKTCINSTRMCNDDPKILMNSASLFGKQTTPNVEKERNMRVNVLVVAEKPKMARIIARSLSQLCTDTVGQKYYHGYSYFYSH